MFATLLLTPRPKHSVVALGKRDNAHGIPHASQQPTQERVEHETALDWACFQRDVTALAKTLFRVDNEVAAAASTAHAPRWLLFTENPYAFAVALTALAQTRRVAVLPPNAQSETLQELAAGCVGFLSDQTELSAALPTLDPLAPGAAAAHEQATPFAARALDANEILLELCTSGSTGKRKRVPKRVRQIDAELAILEKVFGPRLAADTQIFATASHQHLYGLLFRVLWPLVAGRPFRLESFLYPEEILPRMLQTASCALVSTPAHLKRLKDVSDLAALRAHCRAIFSSGGPLAPETAAALTQALGTPPIEILGSTETGGVAWRAQSSASDSLAWSTLPSVEILRATDARLRVRSPFVSEGLDDDAPATGTDREPSAHASLDASTQSDAKLPRASLTMGDCVELLADGKFLLQGRADRIVKIGEKRLALPEMEAQLLQNPLLQEVSLVPLERSGTTRVGAVAVLSEAGLTFLAQHGRRALAQNLTRDLQNRFDRIVLPRAWRYVARLPEDAQGKVTQSLLRAQFERVGKTVDTIGDDLGHATANDASSPTETHAAVASPSAMVFDPQCKAPQILHEERSATACRWRCRVPENLAYCDGHFPMHPIVPGVVQLDWVMTAAHALWENLPPPIRIEALKFKTLLLPGQEFELTLQRTSDKLSFTLRNANAGEEIFSSGRFVLPTDGEKALPQHG